MPIADILRNDITSEKDMAGIIRLAALGDTPGRPFLQYFNSLWSTIGSKYAEKDYTVYTNEVKNAVISSLNVFPADPAKDLYNDDTLPSWTILRDFARRNYGVWAACQPLLDILDRKLIALHEPHYPISTEQSMNPKIAVYRTVSDKKKDKVTVMKLGRFLKFLGDMDDQDIIEVVNRVKVELNLYTPTSVKWARTAEEIVRVYNNGPRSCMNANHGGCDLRSVPHPASVYESPDIGVAYIEDTNATSFHVLARAVVNLKKKAFPVAYGDTNQLDTILLNSGFTRDDNALVGARILLLEDEDIGPDAIVLPYIDKGGLGADYNDDPNYLIIQRNGALNADGTRGWASNCPHAMDYCDSEEEELSYCGCCDDAYHEEELRYVGYEDISVCERCLDAHYVYASVSARGDAMDYIPIDDAISVDGDYYLNDASVLAHHSLEYAEDIGEYRHTDDLFWSEAEEAYLYNALAVHGIDETEYFTLESVRDVLIHVDDMELYTPECAATLPAEDHQALVSAHAYLVAYYWSRMNAQLLVPTGHTCSISAFTNGASYYLFIAIRMFIRRNKLCDIESYMQSKGYELDPCTWTWSFPRTDTNVTYNIAA